jgi:hypothetical protein
MASVSALAVTIVAVGNHGELVPESVDARRFSSERSIDGDGER